jgi:hypothetical protein
MLLQTTGAGLQTAGTAPAWQGQLEITTGHIINPITTAVQVTTIQTIMAVPVITIPVTMGAHVIITGQKMVVWVMTFLTIPGTITIFPINALPTHFQVTGG